MINSFKSMTFVNMRRDFKYIMSYLAIVLAIGFLGFSSCDPPRDTAWKDGALRYEYVKEIGIQTEAVTSDSKKLAQNSVIAVSFYGGTEEQKAHVKKYFDIVFDRINLSYEVVPVNGDVRISFDPSGGAWSYIGTDSYLVNRSSPTMNLGWLEPSGRVVTHELFHQLGFNHEHQSPDPESAITWNDPVVIADMAKSGWTEAMTRSNILNRLNPNRVSFTALDIESIMLYYFPQAWIIGTSKAAQRSNNVPSKLDWEILESMYPKTLEPAICTDLLRNIIALVDGADKNLSIIEGRAKQLRDTFPDRYDVSENARLISFQRMIIDALKGQVSGSESFIK